MIEGVTENWIDIIIFSVIIVSVGLGLWSGFMSTCFSILSLVLGFYIAKEHGLKLFAPFAKLLGEGALALALSYGIVFLLVVLVFNALTFLLRRGLRKMQLGGMDVFVGGLFGLVRGLLFSVILVLILNLAAFGKTKEWAESVTVPYIGKTIKLLVTMPYINQYKAWVRFDRRDRPTIIVPKHLQTKNDGTFSLHSPELKQRDKVLDEVLEELVEHSDLGKYNKASEMAMDEYKKRQEKAYTPLQILQHRHKVLLCDGDAENCE